MQKFILGLAGLLLACCGFSSQAAVLTTAPVSGFAGDKVTVVLFNPAATPIAGLSVIAIYDTSLLTFQKFLFGQLMGDWDGLVVEAPLGEIYFGISPVGVPNAELVPAANSLIGLEFLINSPFTDPNSVTTQVGFSCFKDTPTSSTCLDEPFADVVADVTILPRATAIPTPASLPLAATALTVLLCMHLLRQRRVRARAVKK